MNNSKIKMGTLGENAFQGHVKDITFCVTEECNLRCKYCYMVNKNSFRRMSIETAKKAVDFLLAQPCDTPNVIWDFIGGEPTLEMELIDQITDYIKLRMYELNHPWFDHYIFSIGTNGLLYHTEAVQRYIKKNRSHVAFSITIDGTKEKHDLNRVHLDGRGSYDEVIKNIPLWQQQFPYSETKVTFSSPDLKYLKESIIHLWNLGLKIIPANTVYEDVWQDGDVEIYSQQLHELADYILDNHMWEDYSVRFFDPNCGLPLTRSSKEVNFCGSGKMVAIDCDGKLYPCIRFLDFCRDAPDQNTLVIGDISIGYNAKIQEMFSHLSIDIVNDGECAKCPVAGDCFSCAGNNYSYSRPHTIFSRTKFHCEMHKARAMANEYFWDRLSAYLDEPSPHEQQRKNVYLNSGFSADGLQYLYIVMSDAAPSYCMYKTANGADKSMTESVFLQSFDFAKSNHMLPVIVGDSTKYLTHGQRNQYFIIIDKFKSQQQLEAFSFQTIIPIIETEQDTLLNYNTEVCILSISKTSIPKLACLVQSCSKQFLKINISFTDILSLSFHDITTIKEQVSAVKGYFVNDTRNRPIINILGEQHHTECTAGSTSWAVAPNGKIYFCPAFYHTGKNSIGDIWGGIDNYDRGIFSKEKRVGCTDCSVGYCKRCYALNLMSNYSENITCKELCHFYNNIN